MKVTGAKVILEVPRFNGAYHYPVVRCTKLSSELKLHPGRCANNKSRCFRHLIQIMKNTNQRATSQVVQDRACGGPRRNAVHKRRRDTPDFRINLSRPAAAL